MNQSDRQKFTELLLEAGRRQSSISAAGATIARGSQHDWEVFITNLLYGGGEHPAIKAFHALVFKKSTCRFE